MARNENVTLIRDFKASIEALECRCNWFWDVSLWRRGIIAEVYGFEKANRRENTFTRNCSFERLGIGKCTSSGTSECGKVGKEQSYQGLSQITIPSCRILLTVIFFEAVDAQSQTIQGSTSKTQNKGKAGQTTPLIVSKENIFWHPS